MADLKNIKLGTYKSSRQNVNTTMHALHSLVQINFLENISVNTKKLIGSFALLGMIGTSAWMGSHVANDVADQQNLKTEKIVQQLNEKQIQQANNLGLLLTRIETRIHKEQEMRFQNLDQIALMAGQDKINKKEADKYHKITEAMISSAVDQYDLIVKHDMPIEITEKFELKLNTFNEYGYNVSITSAHDSYSPA